MADFDPPFGSDAERRLATALEKELGFGCGPASQSLFNGLFWQLQSELAAIHAEAGITPDDSTSTTTLDAILALISAATGGNPDGYILMTQARARLPIFPDVQNTDGRIVVTSPSTGTVRIPGGVEFLHRGIFTITTAQTDFSTTASKIYHLRWNPTDGFALIETGKATYNPGSLAETDPAFDSTYDDMLIARVVTNSSNVATITNLANKNILKASGEATGPGVVNLNVSGSAGFGWENNVAPSAIANYLSVPINFARRPDAYLQAVNDIRTQPYVPSSDGTNEMNFGARCRSRYQVELWAQGDPDVILAWAVRT